MQKGDIFRANTRGCDVARKALWQSHADPRECLRGTEVTYTYIYFITYGYTYKPSIEEFANRYNLTHIIYPTILHIFFSVWDYYSSFLLIIGHVV